MRPERKKNKVLEIIVICLAFIAVIIAVKLCFFNKKPTQNITTGGVVLDTRAKESKDDNQTGTSKSKVNECVFNIKNPYIVAKGDPIELENPINNRHLYTVIDENTGEEISEEINIYMSYSIKVDGTEIFKTDFIAPDTVVNWNPYEVLGVGTHDVVFDVTTSDGTTIYNVSGNIPTQIIIQ